MSAFMPAVIEYNHGLVGGWFIPWFWAPQWNQRGIDAETRLIPRHPAVAHAYVRQATTPATLQHIPTTPHATSMFSTPVPQLMKNAAAADSAAGMSALLPRHDESVVEDQQTQGTGSGSAPDNTDVFEETQLQGGDDDDVRQSHPPGNGRGIRREMPQPPPGPPPAKLLRRQ